MFDAFILAAGFGTRLRPLTDELPKPLVPVCGVPMLAYALAQCAHHGLTNVVVNAHWKAEQLRPWAGHHEGCNVTISEEIPDILGTGGGLKLVQEHLSERFVVLNGDVLNTVDLDSLMERIPDGSGVLALRAHAEDAQRYGIVAADETGTLVKLRDIASAATHHGELRLDTHFTGIHAMDRQMLEWVEPGFSCIIRTAYKALVPERRVQSIRHHGVWLDIGDPAAYIDANLAVLGGGLELALDPRTRAASWVDDGTDPDRVGPLWLGHHCDVPNGVRLIRSIIGHGATISAGACLEDCVVWDGAHVPAGEHRRTIFYGTGQWTDAS